MSCGGDNPTARQAQRTKSLGQVSLNLELYWNSSYVQKQKLLLELISSDIDNHN